MLTQPMFLFAVALFFSCCALILATIGLARLARLIRYMPTARKLAALEAAQGDMAEQLDSLMTQLRRMRSKYSARDRRKKKREEDDLNAAESVPDPAQDPDGWKRHMRQQLHLGKIKVR